MERRHSNALYHLYLHSYYILWNAWRIKDLWTSSSIMCIYIKVNRKCMRILVFHIWKFIVVVVIVVVVFNAIFVIIVMCIRHLHLRRGYNHVDHSLDEHRKTENAPVHCNSLHQAICFLTPAQTKHYHGPLHHCNEKDVYLVKFYPKMTICTRNIFSLKTSKLLVLNIFKKDW